MNMMLHSEDIFFFVYFCRGVNKQQSTVNHGELLKYTVCFTVKAKANTRKWRIVTEDVQYVQYLRFFKWLVTKSVLVKVHVHLIFAVCL